MGKGVGVVIKSWLTLKPRALVTVVVVTIQGVPSPVSGTEVTVYHVLHQHPTMPPHTCGWDNIHQERIKQLMLMNGIPDLGTSAGSHRPIQDLWLLVPLVWGQANNHGSLGGARADSPIPPDRSISHRCVLLHLSLVCVGQPQEWWGIPMMVVVETHHTQSLLHHSQPKHHVGLVHECVSGSCVKQCCDVFGTFIILHSTTCMKNASYSTTTTQRGMASQTSDTHVANKSMFWRYNT